ncbi:tRNA pseudouridine(13) synthase TruD [Alcanivorax sp. 1008]|uniref:tRNA pseudouridine(13) synthase TruD n=1 Tax=Alcanivorax sp. 1008 TaxID=2816853 RepID=UPI001D4E98AB|nr:tRNA pseudouridine(13) synthase TruD [Alcanivorax sp. 1008]MCC1495571.1 tRNA pseudouridine(13) synthase TruD [Alcanivorax sp. 1008]
MTEVCCQGILRQAPQDFQVREQLGFEPGGGGEHLWLHLRKTGVNTMDLALALAKLARLPVRSVGYSGLKDRHAVTEQWFSLHLPGKSDPDLTALPAGVELLQAVRHSRKLNRGTHRSNAFSIVVRELSGAVESLPEKLEQIRRDGVPNYFGEQRFGHQDNNFRRAAAWLNGEGEAPRKSSLRGLWLSVVRSKLFNEVLAERHRLGLWNQLVDGDLLQPEGSRGLFRAEDEPQAAQRIASGEVHPTAPLPGAGGMASSSACAELELRVLQPHQALIEALAKEGVEAARRSTRLPVTDLYWQLEGNALRLSFSLPAGAFATTVLANFLDWNEHVADR